MSFELVLIGNMSFSVSTLKVLFIFFGFQNFNLAISWYGLLVYLIWIYSSFWFFFPLPTLCSFWPLFLKLFQPHCFSSFAIHMVTLLDTVSFFPQVSKIWGFFCLFSNQFSLSCLDQVNDISLSLSSLIIFSVVTIVLLIQASEFLYWLLYFWLL